MSGSLTESNQGHFKLEVTWMLSEEEISEIRASAADGKNRKLNSKPFAGGAWQMVFEPVEEDDLKPCLYLAAIPQEEDYRCSSSRRAWSRNHKFDYVLKTVLPLGSPDSDIEECAFLMEFDSESRRWGFDLSMTLEHMIAIYDKKKSFGFKCILNVDHFVPPSSTAYDRLAHFFDNSTLSDTLFVVHRAKEPPVHIFACEALLVSASSHFRTLFESGFSESSTQKRFNVDNLRTFSTDPGLEPSLMASFEQQLVPFFLSTPESPAKAAGEDIPRPESTSEDDDSSLEPPRKKVKLENEVENTDEGKLLNVIEVRGTDFTTYRAMVAYLHIPIVPFLPLPSDFLVELENEDREEDDIFAAFRESPALWLDDTYWKLEHHSSPDIDPCSSHAMYRLADCYGMEDLRDLSLGFIVRSLTVKNVAYELFSPLSLDYENVQKVILEFLVKNWKEVKKTKGFATAVKKANSGEIPKGEELLLTIFQAI